MSGRRNLVLANGEFYHIFNHSVSNEQIFVRKKDIKRVLDLLPFYQVVQKIRFSYFNRLKDEEKKEYLKSITCDKPAVEIHAYCLMPNHYHLLLRQREKDGVRYFVSNFQNGFAKFFNTRNKRVGSLFQRPFKARHVSTDEEFLHLSRYIHLNPVTAYLMEIDDLCTSHLSSFSAFTMRPLVNFVNTQFTLGLVGGRERYQKFVANQIDYQRKLAKIKHLLME